MWNKGLQYILKHTVLQNINEPICDFDVILNLSDSEGYRKKMLSSWCYSKSVLKQFICL